MGVFWDSKYTQVQDSCFVRKWNSITQWLRVGSKGMIGNHSGFHLMISCHAMTDLNTVMLIEKAEENTFLKKNKKNP